MDDKIKELYSYYKKINAPGGEEKNKKRAEKGILTARGRIDLLADENSFVEMESFAELRCPDFGLDDKKTIGDGVVCGFLKINGRPAYVASQDFTVMGGSLGEVHASKIAKTQNKALENGVPFIAINDSGGARIQEGVRSLDGYGKIFYANTQSSGIIPQLTAILGPCAGGAVYSPGISDFIFMVNEKSHMFITGPQVIKTVTGEDVSFEDLGGARVHNEISGVAHFFDAGEKECLENIKRLLSFLPLNNKEFPPIVKTSDSSSRHDDALRTLIPEETKKSYDMMTLILSVLDNNDFMEVQPLFAKNIIVGFGRLAGITVGIVANQPKCLAGTFDINASDKAARFIRFCSAFNIPVINLVDVPGFLPGVNQEHGGIIRHGAKVLYAYAECRVPKITLIVRKAFGGAYVAMCSPSMGYDRLLAWPSAEIAVMGAEGAANIIFKKEIEKSDDPEKQREQKIQEFRKIFSNPYTAAKAGLIDNVIDPKYTRVKLIEALEMSIRQRKNQPKQDHGNIPL